jgi:diaminopimelate decarboxylase
MLNKKIRTHISWCMKRFDSAFYCYDLDGLKLHLQNLKNETPKGIKLWYACKANPLSSILKEFRDEGFGVDISSLGEMNHVLNVGFDHQDIISTGPCKSKDYLRTLLDNGISTLVVESINQLEWLEEVATEMKLDTKVLLRVRLPWEEGSSVLGGNDITPFGIEPESWSKFDFTKLIHVKPIGFHCFQWGNILDPQRLKKIWSKIAQVLQELSLSLNISMEVLDLGGGLGLDYEENQSPLEIKEFMKILDEIKKRFKLNEIWMELGRFAVGNYGVYATKIIDMKRSGNRELIITEGGINHLARRALTDQSFPASLFRESNQTKQEYFLHGPLCTSLDKQGSYQLPNDISEDDWMIFHKCGAYGFTESMPFFLCHNLPAEIIIKDENREVMRTIKPASEWLV